MKKVIIIIIIMMLFTPTYINATIDKSEKEYITDEAMLLSNETEDYIVKYSKFLKKAKNIEYYVVTTKEDDIDINTYCDEIYKTFSISDKGLLILISKNSRQLKVKAGSDLSDIITNEIIEEHIDNYFLPYLKNDNWDEGIKNGYSSFYKLICNYYNINSDGMQVYNGNDIINKYKIPLLVLTIWLVMVIGNKFSEYFYKLIRQRSEKNILLDTTIISLMLFTNILLLLFSYHIVKEGLLLVFLFELVAIYNGQNINNVMYKKKKKK